jgi:hypothetical protein
MSFDWGEYLSLAEELMGGPVTGPPVGLEAHRRAAISRAYYAAFILARNHLRDVDGLRIPHHVNAHQFVTEQYRYDPDPIRAEIGRGLRRLRSARNRCDYDDVVPNLPALINLSLASAAQILADLARL